MSYKTLWELFRYEGVWVVLGVFMAEYLQRQIASLEERAERLYRQGKERGGDRLSNQADYLREQLRRMV